MNIFLLVVSQSLRLSFRKGGGALGACAFYVIVVMLFTFAMGTQAVTQYAIAIMCISMLLATITTLPLLFERDYEDGTLEQFLLQPVLLEMLVFARICGQFFSHIIPILLVSPLLAVMANLSYAQILNTMLILLLVAPTMVALSAIGAALTIGSKRGGLLQALVIMPLYIPILIFASASEQNIGQGAGGHEAVLFLSGMSFISLPLSCYICSTLIRISED